MAGIEYGVAGTRSARPAGRRAEGSRPLPDALRPREAEFAAWWAAGGALGQDLRTASGEALQIIYQGRRGGPAGPDFRDAIIEVAGRRRGGDVELHLQAADWARHGHGTDPRYNQVILHVARQAPSGTLTRLPSGATVPLLVIPAQGAPARLAAGPAWPCQAHPPPPGALVPSLHHWGAVRFAERVTRFQAELAQTGMTCDRVLERGIAEALGYGRDPIATRMAFQMHDATLDRLSARRVAGLHALLARMGLPGIAARCCGAILAGGVADGWERLIALFTLGGATIGQQRAAIVVWNVVLPCLVAFGQQQGNLALASLASSVAAAAPGLPSNTITRTMAAWLNIPRAPSGALAQQGLHHLHAQWCQRKRCDACPLGALPAG